MSAELTLHIFEIFEEVLMVRLIVKVHTEETWSRGHVYLTSYILTGLQSHTIEKVLREIETGQCRVHCTRTSFYLTNLITLYSDHFS
jgi:hypothetical protein